MAKHLDVDQNRVVIGNGARELISAIVRCYVKHLAIPVPTFDEYGNRATNQGKPCSYFPTDETFHLDIKKFIEYGASPRASIYLALAGKAYAFMQGRNHVVPQDIKTIGHDILRHRIITTYEAEASSVVS